MPKIKVTDPVSRYYNAKVGNIVKIKRFSGTSGFNITYKVVINSSLFW